MTQSLEFILNGRTVRADRVSPNLTLLEFLRRRGLTGSKEGCAEGDCGACSAVLVDRDADGQPAYRAVNSCLLPICLMAGRELLTVEAIGDTPGLHPVQTKMLEGFGSQCGYCTPGFICSLFEGFYRDDLRAPADLNAQLCGNLCRCTGYRSIRDAAAAAYAERHTLNGADRFAVRLTKSAPAIPPANYECAGERFVRPGSLAELWPLLDAHPDARLVAGATELGLDITKRYHRFPALLSLEAVSELKELRRTVSEWHIGAAVTLTDIEAKPAAEFPALADMLLVFGSRQVRNRATIGGNLVTASPIGDFAPVLLALDAKVVLASNLGERQLPLSDFFVAYRKTALLEGELLKTIIVPHGPSQPGLTRRSAWFKVSKRLEMDISTVAACFTVDLDSHQVVRHARLAYGGVAPMPARAKATESALLGRVWNDATLRDILPALQSEFTPLSDVRGSADYRRGLVISLFEKFFSSTQYPETKFPLTPTPRPKERGTAPTTAGGSPLLGERGRGEGEFGDLGDTASSPVQPQAAIPHESAHKHVTGAAMYVDDLACAKNFLEVWPVCSPHARARILNRDASAARQLPGVKAVLLAEDVPGVNDVGMKRDETLLAYGEVLFHGHVVALVVGESLEACRAAAAKVVVDYEPLPPVLTLRQALAQKSFHNEPNFIRRGDAETALASAPLTLEGEFELGGQEHFYLETHAAWADPGEDGSMLVVSSTQHPSEIQQVVAHVLDLDSNQVVVQCPRLGGGFGGKETQAATPAAFAALAAQHTRRPVRVRFNRDQDMALTGHRHPFLAKFKIGFDHDGLLRAARIHLWSNGGWAQDLSQAVTDRALFHLDNAYYLPAVEFRGQVARTNLSSNTAFRGFGGPQGMLVIEEILDRVARRLGLPPELVRERNLYRGHGETNTTHYGQEVDDNRFERIWRELKESAAFDQRRLDLRAWNEAHPHSKRGLAITPVKFGISFTVTHLNQAGAFVLLYQDGTVQVNHGGTEMGQGVHTNIAMIAARELGIALSRIRVMPTSTDKVPNTSATAASCGTDLNGAAVKNACELLRARLAPVAAALLKPAAANNGAATLAETDLLFANDFISNRHPPGSKLAFADVVRQAYLQRISLSATGYYATPGIHWDRAAGHGKPFHYFAQGAAVAEVEVDGFTGMHRVLRVDILHDVGDSINEGINRGQIEGGFIQGMGWLTTEELIWDQDGRLLTHSPDTYKIPSIGDTPPVFNLTFLKNSPQPTVVYGSKAVGEPPLMLAISVREAIRDAVAAFASGPGEVPLASPATSEAIWRAIRQRSSRDHKLAPRLESAGARA